jgi:hypothetical protein
MLMNPERHDDRTGRGGLASSSHSDRYALGSVGVETVW